jgi:hypothetical protein
MSRSLPAHAAREPCAYSDVLARLLELIGTEVEISVTAQRRPARQLIAAVGRLEAGPELGGDDDPLLPIAVGGVELAVKDGWVKSAWRDPRDSSLALLFHGGVLVEIERAPETG